MASTFFGLTIAYTGLQAAQTSINVTSHNLANINNQAYTKETASIKAGEALRSYAKYGTLGAGVIVDAINQTRDSYYDEKYRNNYTNYGQYNVKDTYMSQIQNYLNEFTLKGYSTEYENFFAALNQLDLTPADTSAKNQLINNAKSMTDYFNTLATNLRNVQIDANNEIKDTVNQINSLAQSISSDSLKEKIFTILTNANGEKEYAFIMTDISKFHLINDYWGYETGTKILNFVLRRMELFSASLFVNRYHSDVFVAVLDITGCKSSDVKKQIEEYNRQIIQEILKTFQINYFHLNTGIYYLKDTSIPAEQIISHTNIVREKAKTELSGVCEYTNDIALNEQHCADTIHSFKSALKQKEFKIYFQPKICGKDQTIASAEALVRWQRENDTMWYPDMFLPILEETGEIQALDYYVYEETFAWMNQRQKEGKRVIPVSLNVSPVHFGNIHSFAEKVMALIKQYEINPYHVIFEITETTFIHNIKAVNEMICFFHEQNIRISMDDFGSGYSSLNALKDILFDEVKIDKRFLSDELSENGKIVLQEIFHLLKRTNKSIVCEGVETKEMVDFLVEEGCDELQGYYYYKPMSQNAFEKLLENIV